MEERRRLRRKPLVAALDIYTGDVRKNIGKGYVIDLNEQGMKIVSDHLLDLGDELSLHFRLPNNWKLDFLGTVIYKDTAIYSNAYGIKFQDGQGTVVLKLL